MSKTEKFYTVNKAADIDIIDEKSKVARFPISTEQVDRVGDIILQSGINLNNYNGVVLFNHISTNLPIGQATIEKDAKTGITYAVIKFDCITEQDAAIFQKVAAKTLRSTSVGIRVLKSEFKQAKDLKNLGADYPDNMEIFVITECDLLEISIVNVPANPGATRAASYKDAAEAKKRNEIERELINIFKK